MSTGKVGFWQSIPGIITAGAGFLSAATGVMVALNQTGVVSFKQASGEKPPTQSAPAEPQRDVAPSLPETAKQNEPAVPSLPATGNAVKPASPVEVKPAEANKQISQLPPPPPPDRAFAPAPARAEEQPAAPSSDDNVRIIEASPPREPAPSVPRASGDAPRSRTEAPRPAAEPTEDLRRSRTTEVPTRDVQTREVTTKDVQTKDVRTRDVPPESVRRLDPQAETRPVVPEKQVERRPSPPVPSSAQEKVLVPPAEGPKDLSTGKRPEPAPAVPPSSVTRPADEDEAKSPKIRRLPRDEVNVNKDKAEPKRERSAAGDDEPGDRRPAASEGRTRKSKAGSDAAGTTAGRLNLAGLQWSVPAGWVQEAVEPGTAGTVAVLKIPNPGGRGADATVRITHHTGGKGKDMEDRQIARWLSQVTKPDGSPMKPSDAKISRDKVGTIPMTLVELTGTMKLAAKDTGQPGQRMLAAVFDHAEGPHTVVITGPAASWDHWASSIETFLKSARAE